MKRSCENCRYVSKGTLEMPCVRCKQNGFDIQDRFQPMTNADHIRSLSDEELAEFIDNNVKNSCDFCDCDVKEKNYHFNADCIRSITKWLQQPRKVEEDV